MYTEYVVLKKFNKLKPLTIPMEQFHSQLSDESDQDVSTNVTHIFILLRLIIL